MTCLLIYSMYYLRHKWKVLDILSGLPYLTNWWWPGGDKPVITRNLGSQSWHWYWVLFVQTRLPVCTWMWGKGQNNIPTCVFPPASRDHRRDTGPSQEGVMQWTGSYLSLPLICAVAVLVKAEFPVKVMVLSICGQSSIISFIHHPVQFKCHSILKRYFWKITEHSYKN